MIVCLLASASESFADNKNKKMMNGDGRQRTLSRNAEPRAPKMGSDVPGRNSHFSGHEGGYQPFQGGGQNQGPPAAQNPDRPTGGPAWMRKDDRNNHKKGGVDQFGRDAQLKNLTDPTGGFKQISGKDPGFGNNLSDEPIGANGVTGNGGSTPAFPMTTVPRGYGKNKTSKESEQGVFANTQMMGLDNDATSAPSSSGPVPIPYPNIGGNSNSGNGYNVLYTAPPAHNISTAIPVSNGDNAGTTTGVASGTVMGKTEHAVASSSVLVGGSRATTGSTTPVPSQTKVIVLAGTPNPDAVDEGHVPDSVKRFSNFGQKDPRDIEAERKRQTGLPGEGGNHGGLRRDDIEVTSKDMLAKRTDNRTQSINDDGTTTNLGGGTNPDVDIDPVTGQPKKGKTKGGGGDAEHDN